MLTLLIILTGLPFLLSVAFFFWAIADREWSAVLWCGFCSVAFGGFLFAEIDALRKGNEQVVEYRFSTDHYKVAMEVVSTSKTVYIDGVETIAETRDTTYIITGVEPIVIKNNNYERKVIE